MFFYVYASKEAKANVLISFAEVEDVYDITYIHVEALVVQERDLVLHRQQKLYIVDWF